MRHTASTVAGGVFDDSWITPASFEGDGGTTSVGAMGSDHHAMVDERGLVTPWANGWSIDWWVGGDDRWYFPSREPTVRQRLVDDTPVVETVMRVPSGEARHRVYGVPDATPSARYGPGPLVVIEVENDSPVPFAAGLALRPYNPTGPSPIGTIEVVDDVVVVDRRPALLLPRPPAASADSLFIFPVAHRTMFRVAVLLEPRRRAWRSSATTKLVRELRAVSAAPTGVPSASDAARGWIALSRPGMRFDLPAGPLARAVDANRRFQMLCDVDSSDDLASTVRPWDEERVRERLAWFLANATPTFTWPRVAPSEFLGLVRSMLVREEPEGLVICSVVPEDWFGQNFAVHDVPTSFGRLGFAVRWHGERAALLWDVQADPARPEPVRLTAPGLDPAWSSTQTRGEALLEPLTGRTR